ncbi:period circadian protein-like isoform X2 [Portunus trituberculatus]|uniref:period circadian protein-like isoform X2 n=1 Tax=Portunus trituberculatus TaxID=210409 RepID=UPI001E1CFCDB|nr:period circadian protein-like isoform X2 [Portunus trituberculatus]WQB60163.1 period-protein [Portunus trituberculatus]
MADTESGAVTMEEQEQGIDDAKNPCQQDSAYGSLESSSQGPSQKSSYSGSKSLNSGSSHSSGFGDNADFSENCLKDTKHKDHKRKKTKEKAEKKVEKAEKLTKEEKKEKEKTRSVQDHHDPRLASETASSIATGLEESSLAFNCNSNDGDERTDQPNLVYTQALNYIRKIKERSAEQGVPFASPELAQLPRDTHDIAAFLKSFKSTRGFTVAISVQDGLVLQVSPAITDVLGFPKDMLIGQSFIDFVYPKDSINLSSKIIHGLNLPFRNESIKDNYGTSFFCRMRMYHSLRSSGFGVRNKRTIYKPCKMILKFHDPTCLDETASTCGSNSSLLLAEVIPIQSIYQVPEETPAMGSFSIRHTASCNFSEYDPEAIPYLGHLPQDLTGNSVFDCYHPEDLPLLKEAYEEMVREQGNPHRSKPYRFRTFNGSYVMLETEWLCFVNPWTKRIDSIIGQHRVLKGPSDIAIFLDPGDKAPTPLPEEVMKEAQKAQKEIIELLAKPVVAYKDPSKGSQEIRRRTLANMMSSIVDELDNLEKNETQVANQYSLPTMRQCTKAGKPHHHPPDRPDHNSPFPTTQDQASVVMGEISPHQDDRCYESYPSTSTPSSYSKLNYNETMQRFFRSQPKTVSSDESGDSKMEVSHLGSLGSNTNKQSQDNSQSQSGSGSGDNCDHTRKSESTANGSGSGSGATGRTSSQGRSYKHVQLTEEVLSRHNADMQKMFMQRQRTGPKPHKDKGKLKPMKKLIKRPGERTCGVKRGGGAMEHEATASKQPFLAPSAAGSSSSLKPSSVDVWGQGESQTHIQSSGSAGATVGPGTTHVAASQYPSIVPGFYFPTSTSSISQVPPVSRAPAPVPLVLPSQQPTFLHPQGVAAVPVQYIPGVMYQPVGPPLFNAPPLMLPNVVYQHTAVHTPLNQVPVPVSDGEKPSGAESDHDLFEPIPQSAKSFIAKHSTSHLRRPDSQATSVKAEPGSARGSTASASGKVISSHSHVAESIRSYVEDTTTVSPGCAPKDTEKKRASSQVSQYSQSTSVRAEAESIGSPEKQDKMTMEPRHENSSDMVLSVTSSTGSPGEYKSSDDSMQNVSDSSEVSGMGMKWNIPRAKCQRPVLSDPPWLEDVKLTPELLYKYQLETKELVDVLRHDMDKLKSVRQPTMVDDQLSSLYNELELDGSSPDLHLEDGVTSSSGDDQAGTSSQQPAPRKKRSSSYFSKMAMLHEEDAPMPPSEVWCCHRQHAPETSSSSS